MNTTTLATFRIDKKTWKKFKKWAAAKDSNASKELNEFIKRALGLIDEDIDTNLDDNLEKRIEDYLETNVYTRMPLSYEWNPCPVSLLGIRNWGLGMGAESLQGNKSASQLKEYYPNP